MKKNYLVSLQGEFSGTCQLELVRMCPEFRRQPSNLVRLKAKCSIHYESLYSFCLFDWTKFKENARESQQQTLRWSELKRKGHVPRWWRSALPWSPAWPAPQPAPLVAGAINEDQKQNTIICFLVSQEQLFLTCPLTLITCKTGFKGSPYSNKSPKWWKTVEGTSVSTELRSNWTSNRRDHPCAPMKDARLQLIEAIKLYFRVSSTLWPNIFQYTNKIEPPIPPVFSISPYSLPPTKNMFWKYFLKAFIFKFPPGIC